MRGPKKKNPEVRFKGFSDDWEQRKFEVMSDSFEYGLNASAMKFDGENKYIRITDIDDKSREFLKDNLTSPNIDLSSADHYLLKTGDILFARTGASVGKSYIYNDNDGKVYYAGFLIRARIKSEYDANFIFQNTLTRKYNNYIAINSQRSGQPGVNAKEYSNYPIMTPVLKEQEALGCLFKQMDDTIALHQRKLDKLKLLKKAYLQVMFPQEDEVVPRLRFADYNDEWEQRKLNEMTNITMGQSPNGENYTENPNDHILVQGNADIQMGWVTPRVWTTQVTKTANVGDIILSVRAPVGDVGQTKYDVVLGRGVAGIQGNGFIFHTLTKMKSNGFWRRYSTGSTFQSINSSDLKDAIIFTPKKEEQNKIGGFLNPLDNTIALYQSKLHRLNSLKKSLLQKMFI